MRFVYPLMVLLFAPALAVAQAEDPAMEGYVIADGDSGSEWSPAEATMEPDETHSRAGSAMRFHIDVNHETGQPDYPIGWPRTHTAVPEEQQDWREWDFVDFWLYADTSRESLPDTPLGFIVRSPDRPNSYNTSLGEAKKGEWVHFRFPTSDMPNPAECTRIQFYISESNYNHDDVVDFWVDDLALLRYAEPTIIGMRPLNRVQYADAEVVRVQIELTGMDEGERAEVLARLVCNGSPVRQGTARLGAGAHTIPLKVGGNMPIGQYQIHAQIVGSDRTATERMRVISSPWEGEAQ
jgi:hypothetical protein